MATVNPVGPVPQHAATAAADSASTAVAVTFAAVAQVFEEQLSGAPGDAGDAKRQRRSSVSGC